MHPPKDIPSVGAPPKHQNRSSRALRWQHSASRPTLYRRRKRTSRASDRSTDDRPPHVPVLWSKGYNPTAKADVVFAGMKSRVGSIIPHKLSAHSAISSINCRSPSLGRSSPTGSLDERAQCTQSNWHSDARSVTSLIGQTRMTRLPIHESETTLLDFHTSARACPRIQQFPSRPSARSRRGHRSSSPSLSVCRGG